VGSGGIVDLWTKKLDFRMGPFAVLGCREVRLACVEFQIFDSKLLLRLCIHFHDLSYPCRVNRRPDHER
jgi:hypothetical protein